MTRWSGPRGFAVARIAFGMIWLIDAVLKWLPGFSSDYLAMIKMAAQGQPAWLHFWFAFWVQVSSHGPHLWALAAAVTETVVALSLVAGVAEKAAYVLGAVWSLGVWAVPEGFGGPYVSGVTDIGTAVIYAFIFVILLVAVPSPWHATASLDGVIVNRHLGFRRWTLLPADSPAEADADAPSSQAGPDVTGRKASEP